MNEKRAELQFLIDCSILYLRSKPIDLAEFNLDINTKFQEIYQLARVHSIEPMILNIFTKQLNILSEKNQLFLKHQYQNLLYRNLSKMKEILKINDQFSEDSINSIFYKGGILSEQLYGNLGGRSFNDIDILVDKQQLADVKKSLSKIQYTLKEKFKFNSKKEEDIFFQKRNEIEYYNIRNNLNTTIDLHWTLSSPLMALDINTNHFYDEGFIQDYNINEATIKTFKVEFLPILFTIHHGGNDLWNKLKHFHDWATLIVKHEKSIDWKSIHTLAQKYDIENILYISLVMLEKLLKISSPPDLYIYTKNKKIQRIAERRISKLIHYDGGKPLDEWYYRIWFRFITAKKYKTKYIILKRCLKTIFLRCFSFVKNETLQHK